MNIDFEIYSPVHQIHDKLFDEQGLKVFIKRDDLIHPIISGNKWRKLKYLLREAQAQNKTHLVTFGGAYSNHLLATSAAAARFGFKSTGFVRGEQVNNDTLFLCRLHGLNLIFTDRESYRNKQALFNKYFTIKSKDMWEEKNNSLYKKFEFKDFSEAFAFMTRVAIEAEKMNHHPLWTNVWNRVEIWLSTHDAGDIVTDKDRKLSQKIDKIVS